MSRPFRLNAPSIRRVFAVSIISVKHSAAFAGHMARGIANVQLQCVAVCCSVLQCVAVCCSVLQCVADAHFSCKIDLECSPSASLIFCCMRPGYNFWKVSSLPRLLYKMTIDLSFWEIFTRLVNLVLHAFSIQSIKSRMAAPFATYNDWDLMFWEQISASIVCYCMRFWPKFCKDISLLKLLYCRKSRYSKCTSLLKLLYCSKLL